VTERESARERQPFLSLLLGPRKREKEREREHERESAREGERVWVYVYVGKRQRERTRARGRNRHLFLSLLMEPRGPLVGHKFVIKPMLLGHAWNELFELR